MRTVYLGTSPFAVAVLERLAASGHRPQLVVTRPDRPRGRGRRVSAPPVAEAARSLGLELAQPDAVNDPEARALIAAARPDAVVICAFGALIREPLLSEHELLNVHPSLLPRWRGAAPIERAIEAGDEVTGVSIMRPVAELDAGPVCLAREHPIAPGEDFGSLSARLAELAGELLVEALDRRPPWREQPEEGATIAPKIEVRDRRLDPLSCDALSLERRVRALNPHIGAWIELPGRGEASEAERLGVRAARAHPDAGWADSAAATGPPEPGTLFAEGARLLLACASGVLELLEVQPPGRRAMSAADWIRGHPAGLGRSESGPQSAGPAASLARERGQR